MHVNQRLCSFARLCIYKTVIKCSSTSVLLAAAPHTPYQGAARMFQRAMSSGPQLSIKPQGHLLVDDKLEMKISGLGKQQKTTLHAVIKEGSNVFESCCCFTADNNGEINLATQPSLAGSYTGKGTIITEEITLHLLQTCLE